MITNSNNWFAAQEFPRFAQALLKARGSLSFMTANLWRAKYLTIRFDQRTGDFLLGDGNNVVLKPEEVYAMFPELGDAQVVVKAAE